MVFDVFWRILSGFVDHCLFQFWAVVLVRYFSLGLAVVAVAAVVGC